MYNFANLITEVLSSPGNILSDENLIRKLEAADTDALKLIYERYGKKLYLAAYNLLRNKETCEDLIHDLFVDLWVKRDTYNIAVLKPYLYAAIRNRVLMHLRSSKSTVDIALLEFADDGQTPEQLFTEKEVSKIAHQEISNLPEKCREIYKLSRFEQRSHKEISILKGISTKTVENQITIALKRLRPALKDYIAFILLMTFLG